MTPRATLLNLVARVGNRDGSAVRISETDVRQWPPRPSLPCRRTGSWSGRVPPGPWCVPAAKPTAPCRCRRFPRGRARPCDSSSVTNAATSTGSRSPRHTWTNGNVMPRRSPGFVVEQLGLRRSRHRVDASGTRLLGLAVGDTRHQMLGLRTHRDVTLVVADTAVALEAQRLVELRDRWLNPPEWGRVAGRAGFPAIRSGRFPGTRTRRRRSRNGR